MFDLTLIQAVSLLLYLVLIAYVARSAGLTQNLKHKTRQHLLFGSAAGLFVLWIFRTGIYPGLDVHFLWLTACVLLLGLRMSIISSCIALLGTTVVGNEPWQMLGINGLFGIVIPIGLSYLIYNIAFHPVSYTHLRAHETV